MNRPPHPSLGRLYALGGAPARAVERLGRPLPALAAIARDLSDIDLLSDRILEPLLRALDLSEAIERALAGEPGGARPEAAPGGGGGPAPVERPPAVPMRTRTAERREPRGPALRVGDQREQVAAVLEPYGNAREVATAQGMAGGRAGATARAGVPVRAPGQVRPRADADGNADAPWQPDGNAQVAAGAGAKASATGGGGARATVRTPSRAEAQAALREKAARAGGPRAADTPLGGTRAAPEVVVLLQGAAPEVVRPGGGDEGAANPAPSSKASEGLRRPMDGRSQLVRSFDRIGSLPARRATAAGLGAASPRPPGPAPAFPVDGGEGPPSPSPADGPRVGGLRGLAAQVSGPGRAIGSRPTAAGLEREDALPDVVLERMREAELAERIDRLLRREAGRQGLDLEGVAG